MGGSSVFYNLLFLFGSKFVIFLLFSLVYEDEGDDIFKV